MVNFHNSFVFAVSFNISSAKECKKKKQLQEVSSFAGFQLQY